MARVGSTAVAVACAAAISAGGAFAQMPPDHTGHEAHMAAAMHKTAVRVMTPQPVIGDLAFVNQLGRHTTLSEVLAADGPVLVNFIFTSCTTICPVMTAGFAQFQASLGEERERVRLVSISIDPDTDTVDRLREYAERYKAGDTWQFLTGTPAAVEAAQRAFGAFRGDRTNHAPATYLRRAAGAQWEELDGLTSADALMRAYRGETVHQQ